MLFCHGGHRAKPRVRAAAAACSSNAFHPAATRREKQKPHNISIIKSRGGRGHFSLRIYKPTPPGSRQLASRSARPSTTPRCATSASTRAEATCLGTAQTPRVGRAGDPPPEQAAPTREPRAPPQSKLFGPGLNPGSGAGRGGRGPSAPARGFGSCGGVRSARSGLRGLAAPWLPC